MDTVMNAMQGTEGTIGEPQEQAAAKPVVLLTIHAGEPKLEAGQQVVFFRRKKVAEADSYRAVCVPAYVAPSAVYQKTVEGNEVEITDAEEVFSVALSECINAAASDILRRYCDDNKAATTIDASLLTFAAVVTEMQAQQTSQRLNGDAIAAWYDASKTKQDATTRYASKPDTAEKLGLALREKYLSLASNNPNIPPALAVKMLAYISPEDTSSTVCKAIAKKLAKLSEVSMQADDL